MVKGRTLQLGFGKVNTGKKGCMVVGCKKPASRRVIIETWQVSKKRAPAGRRVKDRKYPPLNFCDTHDKWGQKTISGLGGMWRGSRIEPKAIRIGKRMVFDERKGGGFNEFSRLLYYDSQTFHVFMLSKKGGKTRRQYLSASVYEYETQGSYERRRGKPKRHFRQDYRKKLRFWLSSKKKATKFDPEKYRFAPVLNPYGKTKHFPFR